MRYSKYRANQGVISFERGVSVVIHTDLKSIRRMRLMYDHLAPHLESYIASER